MPQTNAFMARPNRITADTLAPWSGRKLGHSKVETNQESIGIGTRHCGTRYVCLLARCSVVQRVIFGRPTLQLLLGVGAWLRESLASSRKYVLRLNNRLSRIPSSEQR